MRLATERASRVSTTATSRNKQKVKKTLPILIVLTLIIVSAVRSCWGGDDDSVSNTEKKELIPIDEKLASEIDSFINSAYRVGSVAVNVFDITAQRELYNYHGEELKRPASCMKLLTCVAALHRLGTRYEYKTSIYADGKIQKDTLYGDLILKTTFDPSFNRDSLFLLLDKLKATNLKAVKGKVKLDMVFTEPMNHEKHWTPGDLKISRMGLIYHGYRRMKKEILYAIPSRTGISLTKDNIVLGRVNPHTSKLLAEMRTPIHYAIDKALKNSSNINAEGLLYPLGYTLNAKGSYRNNGMAYLKKFIREELHLDPAKVCIIDDGCGLCPDDRLSPKLLTAILNYAYKHKRIYTEVYEDLPLSGTDGTLYDRMRKPNVVGKVKAKTGTLTREGGISSLSGYFIGRDNHLLCFSIINNECPVMEGRSWQDKLFSKVIFPK